MASATDLLADGFGRIRETVHSVLDGADDTSLRFRPDDSANTVGWLVWHLTRVQDDHVAEVAGTEQTWTQGGWYEKFGLPFDPADTGYGHDTHAVADVGVPAELLAGYHDAVHAATVGYLRTLSEADLDRVVDDNWDPPVTLAVRLISVLDDDAQHVGQAAYIRGLSEPS